MAQVGNQSKKIAKRVYAKAIKDLRTLHTNTKEAVEKLFASVNLVSFCFYFFSQDFTDSKINRNLTFHFLRKILLHDVWVVTKSCVLHSIDVNRKVGENA